MSEAMRACACRRRATRRVASLAEAFASLGATDLARDERLERRRPARANVPRSCHRELVLERLDRGLIANRPCERDSAEHGREDVPDFASSVSTLPLTTDS
jgi:hypothetical protein